MRPVYHQKTHRVEGHIFITLLAYNLVHQIRCQLKAQGIHDCWLGQDTYHDEYPGACNQPAR